MARKEVAPSIDPEKAHKANMAEHAYLNIDPWVTLGALPVDQLQSWRTDLASGPSTPQRKLYTGWLDIETGYSLYFRDRDPSKRVQPDALPYFESGKKEFDELSNDKKAPKVLQLQAKLASISVPPLAAYLAMDDPQAAAHTHSQYVKELGDFGQKMIDQKKVIEDDTFFHTVTLLSLLNDTPEFSAYPAPSRISSSQLGEQLQSQLYVAFNTTGFTVRVASEGPQNLVRIDPALLRHAEYRAKHPYGTLQATTDLSKHVRIGTKLLNATDRHNTSVGKERQAALAVINSTKREYMNLDATKHERGAHIRSVTEGVSSSLREQLNTTFIDVAHKERISTPEDALAYYENLIPDYPMESSQPELRRAVTVLDKEHTTSGLEASKSSTLAWMHTELGMIKASKGETSRPHFEKAVRLLEHTARMAHIQSDIITERWAQVDVEMVATYASISGAGHPPEVQMPVVVDNLLNISETLIAERDALRAKNPKLAAEYTKLIASLIPVVLLNSETDDWRTHIAAGSTPRQNTDRGWDTTVWIQTPEGFDGTYFGRLNVAYPKRNTYSLPSELRDESILLDVLAERRDENVDEETLAARQVRLEQASESMKNFISDQVE